MPDGAITGVPIQMRSQVFRQKETGAYLPKIPALGHSRFSKSSTTAYTSTRLQVEQQSLTNTGVRTQRLALPQTTFGNGEFFAISTGAVLWLKPTTMTCIRTPIRDFFKTTPIRVRITPAKPMIVKYARSLGSPANGQSTDQDHEVEAPGDHGPSLLRIPVDVITPNDFWKAR